MQKSKNTRSKDKGKVGTKTTIRKSDEQDSMLVNKQIYKLVFENISYQEEAELLVSIENNLSFMDEYEKEKVFRYIGEEVINREFKSRKKYTIEPFKLFDLLKTLDFSGLKKVRDYSFLSSPKNIPKRKEGRTAFLTAPFFVAASFNYSKEAKDYALGSDEEKKVRKKYSSFIKELVNVFKSLHERDSSSTYSTLETLNYTMSELIHHVSIINSYSDNENSLSIVNAFHAIFKDAIKDEALLDDENSYFYNTLITLNLKHFSNISGFTYKDIAELLFRRAWEGDEEAAKGLLSVFRSSLDANNAVMADSLVDIILELSSHARLYLNSGKFSYSLVRSIDSRLNYFIDFYIRFDMKKRKEQKELCKCLEENAIKAARELLKNSDLYEEGILRIRKPTLFERFENKPLAKKYKLFKKAEKKNPF